MVGEKFMIHEVVSQDLKRSPKYINETLQMPQYFLFFIL